MSELLTAYAGGSQRSRGVDGTQVQGMISPRSKVAPAPDAASSTRLKSGPDERFVEFDKVGKSYDGRRWSVADVTLSIRRGEFITLLGPSGSGKTSTLMMLAGFEDLTSGDIRLRGKSLARVAAHRRNMGVVFQNYALFPHMTVAENVSFPLSVRKMARNERHDRVAGALRLVRLEGYEGRRPSELSGGQQQRVALARALIFDPDLVLMDEPLGALDKHLREKLQIEIKQIQAKLGITVVYVTHDQSEALAMSDRIAVFKDGAIQQIDTPRVLYESPQNSFVALFLGESNSLQGHIVEISGHHCMVDIEAERPIRALPINVDRRCGSATMLSIRPECVVLAPREGECDNVMAATVRALVYFGDHTRVRTIIAGNHEIHLKVPNVRGGTSLRTNQEISIGWHSADCRALDPGSERSSGSSRWQSSEETVS